MINGITKMAAAIVWQNNKVLACQLAEDEHEGKWVWPSAIVHDGEDPIAACKRGVEQGIGCKLSTTWLLQTISRRNDEQSLSVDCFVCMLLPNQVPECKAYASVRWLTRNELLDLDWMDADYDVAKMLGVQWDMVFMSEHL